MPIAPCCAIEYVSGSASASVAPKLTGDRARSSGRSTAGASTPDGRRRLVQEHRRVHVLVLRVPWPRLRVSAQAMSVQARPIGTRGTSSMPSREPSVGDPGNVAGTGDDRGALDRDALRPGLRRSGSGRMVRGRRGDDVAARRGGRRRRRLRDRRGRSRSTGRTGRRSPRRPGRARAGRRSPP